MFSDRRTKKGKDDELSQEKRMLIEPQISGISISRQCELLDLSRPSYYYYPVQDNGYNLVLMRMMGIEALYPKPRLSKGSKEFSTYPYL